MKNDFLSHYRKHGYVLMSGKFSPDEVEVLRSQLEGELAVESPRRIVEKNNKVVRSVYGSNRTNEIFDCLARHPRLVNPIMDVLGSKVYVHQFKINIKAPFHGDIWAWHQDFIFWNKGDGMAKPRVMNSVVFLDEVNEFNGPICFLPGSHNEGMIDTTERVASFEKFPSGERRQPYRNSQEWLSNLTAELKFELSEEKVAQMVKRYGIVAPKGPPGSILFFDANIIHGSTNNISPVGRSTIIISYNSVENKLHPIPNPRPDFLASRDFTPIEPVDDDALLKPMPKRLKAG